MKLSVKSLKKRSNSRTKLQFPLSGQLQERELPLKITNEKLNDLRVSISRESEKRQSETSERWKPQPEKILSKNYAKVVNEQRKPRKNEGTIRPYSDKPIKMQGFEKPAIVQKSIKINDNNISQKSNNSLEFLKEKGILMNPNKIEDNIKKAIFKQKTGENKMILDFLQSIELEEYYNTFIDNGFDDLEVIKEINVSHLKEMNIPSQNHKKILLAINPPPKPILKPSNKPTTKASKPSNKLETIIENEAESLKNGVFDEAKSHEYFLEALNEFRAAKKSENIKENAILIKNESNLLRNSSYDEEESHNYFLEALNEFRGNDTKNEKKSLFLYNNEGESEWHNTYMDQVITNKKLMIPCWECLASFDKEKELIFQSKSFCSNICMKEYKKKTELSCYKCKKIFNKIEGIYKNQQWYCSLDCEPKDNELYDEYKKKFVKNTIKSKNYSQNRNKTPVKEKDIDLGLADYEEKLVFIKRLEDLEN